MRFLRLPFKDPRTVARDIPGICDVLFPRLLPGIVAYLNRQSEPTIGCTAVSSDLMDLTSTNAAMLFEVAYANVEQSLEGDSPSWSDCLQIALERQKRFYDAILPERLTDGDIAVADATARNLLLSLSFLADGSGQQISISPKIPGFHWISSGNGDFSVGDKLIEVKCTSSSFSASDYRQLLIYWLLSYSDALENDALEWKTAVLLNPRLNKFIEIEFSELVHIASGGRSKVEVLELFSTLIGDYSLKMT